MDIIAQLDGRAGEVQTLLAREVLIKAVSARSIKIIVEVIETETKVRFPVENTHDSVLLLVSNDANWQNDHVEHFSGTMQRVTYEELFANPDIALAKTMTAAPKAATAAPMSSGGVKKIVAVTSCPTGIAHTFMAAEGLTVAAKNLGYEIRVETQGSVGAGTPLTAEEIANADLVMIAADREVDLSRFTGKRLFRSGTKPAINGGEALIEKAFAEATVQSGVQATSQKTTESSSSGAANIYKHLMSGVSFMLPFVVAGGLLIALSFALGGIDVGKATGTFAYYLNQIGSQGAFVLMVPVLAGYIAYSIADRPGLAPGMIGGLIANTVGAGFLGAIVAGFIAGYTILLAVTYIKLPRDLQGLMPVLILPLIGAAVTGLLMYLVVGTPVAIALTALSNWLTSMQGANAVILGAIIGGMMAVDMGGPINKAAYATSVALIGAKMPIYGPMAAVLIAGMTPPMALAIASAIFPSKFTSDERETKVSTFILGLAFISEGAIPFAARDPLRVIPSLVLGSAVAGAISLGMGVGLRAPHGGIFLAFIPGTIINYFGYFLALIIGTIVSVVALGLIKKAPIQA